MRFVRLAVMAAALPLCAQTPPKKLTLAEAEEIAIHNHPRLQSASFQAQAADKTVTEARSALYPNLGGYVTSVDAENGATVGAGALTTSSLASRAASQVVMSQLITDFGRTNKLIESAQLRAGAQKLQVDETRAEIRLEVDQAFYQALAADAVLSVSTATLANRRLTLRQVRALAQSEMKSTLDVSFAEVAVSEAELAEYRAENDVRESRARLSAALGYRNETDFELKDEPLPGPPDDDLASLIASALKNRPDLAATELGRDAALRFAEAEKRLRYPAISILGVAGAIPASIQPLHGNYTAAGLNVTLPILNGHLYSARHEEAQFRAAAAGKDVDTLMVQVSRDVRIAWLEANDAYRRLDVTNRLVDEANKALRLAQTRYDLGLGSMVELNQAQLVQASAEDAAASARYDYLSRRAALDFVTGALR